MKLGALSSSTARFLSRTNCTLNYRENQLHPLHEAPRGANLARKQSLQRISGQYCNYNMYIGAIVDIRLGYYNYDVSYRDDKLIADYDTITTMYPTDYS